MLTKFVEPRVGELDELMTDSVSYNWQMDVGQVE